MPNTDLTISNITDEVKLALAGDIVDVELSSQTITKIIKDTTRKYCHYKPCYGVAPLVIDSSTKKYGPITAPGFLGVTRVAFVRSDIAGLTNDMFSVFYQSQNQLLTYGPDTFGEIANQLSYLKQISEVAGIEPEWHGQWESGGYFLYIDVRTNMYLCSYFYTFALTPTDDATTGLPLVPASDVDWFLEYCTARAKMILGRGLRKFGGIPNPEGGQDPIDGSDMVTEGAAEAAALEEALKKRRRPLLPITG